MNLAPAQWAFFEQTKWVGWVHGQWLNDKKTKGVNDISETQNIFWYIYYTYIRGVIDILESLKSVIDIFRTLVGYFLYLSFLLRRLGFTKRLS